MDWLVWKVVPQSPVRKFFIQVKYCVYHGWSSPSSLRTACACSGLAPGPGLESDDDIGATREEAEGDRGEEGDHHHHEYGLREFAKHISHRWWWSLLLLLTGG